MSKELKMSVKEKEEFVIMLKSRFNDNPVRHAGLAWDEVEKKLLGDTKKLNIIFRMEETGGEPDVVLLNAEAKQYAYIDCSMESPEGRRSLCYDNEALEKRKLNKPDGNAVDLAKNIGIEILNEEEYLMLQKYGEFDTKTSSWIKTPETIRRLGGALFCDRRYNSIFIYHNSAESYYSSRGFRGIIRL